MTDALILFVYFIFIVFLSSFSFSAVVTFDAIAQHHLTPDFFSYLHVIEALTQSVTVDITIALSSFRMNCKHSSHFYFSFFFLVILILLSPTISSSCCIVISLSLCPTPLPPTLTTVLVFVSCILP